MNAWMDGIKREEPEKACKKKDHKVRAKMAAARVVRVLNMSVEETASLRYAAPRGFEEPQVGLVRPRFS